MFDTLNAKAAIFAITGAFEGTGVSPIMISGTITDASGRTLSGQTTEAFWNSIRTPTPAGRPELRARRERVAPYVAELSRVADCRVSAHPNAGLPNEFGEYDETPEDMAGVVGEFAAAAS